MKRLGKQLVPAAVAVVCGLLLAFCFADWNLTGLVWVWMLPLFPVLWRGERKRYGFALGYLTGLAFWLVNLKWIWTVSGLGAVAMAAFLALYFGIWGAIAATLGNPWRKRAGEAKNAESDKISNIQKKILEKQQGQNSGWLAATLGESGKSIKFACINAAAWVSLEWLRGWLFTGFGWNGLGVTRYL